MSFVAECIRSSLPIWEKCLNTAFLRELVNGTLKAKCFQGYLVDDSLYLREYAKVFAWAMTKAETMEDIRICYSLLSFVNEAEGSTRLYYLDRFGLRDEDIQTLPQRPENKAYTDCMILAARSGGIPECMMACLPCMISYHWIFKKLLEQNPCVSNSFYGRFVRDYASKEYDAACRKWIAYTDQRCAELSPERKAACMRIFRACSEHELRFWEMSEAPRTDL